MHTANSSSASAPVSSVPMLDVNRENKKMQAELEAAMAEVARSGAFVHGPACAYGEACWLRCAMRGQGSRSRILLLWERQTTLAQYMACTVHLGRFHMLLREFARLDTATSAGAKARRTDQAAST